MKIAALMAVGVAVPEKFIQLYYWRGNDGRCAVSCCVRCSCRRLWMAIALPSPGLIHLLPSRYAGAVRLSNQ